MNAYIGAKIIMAEKMSKNDFDVKFKGATDVPNVNESGYHVQYSNPNGSTYDSWSPHEVFERAYRPVSEDEMAMVCSIDPEDIPEDANLSTYSSAE